MINFLNLWNKSGKEYHDYAMAYPQYKKTNEKLIDLAEIKSGQIVIDLACGTGLTTKEILKKCPEVQKVYAVDFSMDMIKIAREIVKEEKVSFILADALELNKIISEKVDTIVCNSSFWQFPNQDKIIESIHTILKDGGRFIFNLNQQFFDFGFLEPTQKNILNAIFSEMKKRGYESSKKIMVETNREKVVELFAAKSFNLKKTESINIGPRTLEDFFDFFKIPATATFFERVPKKEQRKILDAVHKDLKNKVWEIKDNRWVYFVFEKIM